MTETFKGPARFAVYGGKDGQWARITGCVSLAVAKDIIELHRKTTPGCEYSVWEATWTEVKL